MTSHDSDASSNAFERAYRAWAESKFGSQFIASSSYTRELQHLFRDYFHTHVDQHVMMGLLDAQISEERNGLRKARGRAKDAGVRKLRGARLAQLVLLRKIVETAPARYTSADVQDYMKLVEAVTSEISDDLGTREVVASAIASVTLSMTPMEAREILQKLDSRAATSLETPGPYSTFEANRNSISEADRVIFLTFDAHDGNAAAIAGADEYLKIFDEYNLPVTLFFTSTFIRKHPDIAKRACEAGHPIGSHLMTHESPADWPRLFQKSWNKETFLQELLSVDEALREVTEGACGAEPIFRMPFGLADARYSLKQQQEAVMWAQAAGYTHVGWSIDSMDWYSLAQKKYDISLGRRHLYKDKRQVLGEIASALLHRHKGPIFLAHLLRYRGPGEDTPLDLFPEVVHMIQRRGYRLGLITEYLGKRPARTNAASLSGETK